MNHPPPVPELKNFADKYLEYLLDKKRDKAEQLIFKCIEQGITIKEIYLFIFQPTQWEIGRLWQKNSISVAMEHYCTAVTQFIMSQLYEFIFTSEKNSYNLVSTSVSGELHELGIRMVTDFFEMEGWNTFYLGANTPKEGVVEMIKECKADVLAISATLYFNVPQVIELISFIRDKLVQNGPKIIVGGKAFNMSNELWKKVDADLFASSAQDALDRVHQLFN